MSGFGYAYCVVDLCHMKSLELAHICLMYFLAARREDSRTSRLIEPFVLNAIYTYS